MANLSHEFRNKKDRGKCDGDDNEEPEEKPIFNAAEFETKEAKKSSVINLKDADAER